MCCTNECPAAAAAAAGAAALRRFQIDFFLSFGSLNSRGASGKIPSRYISKPLKSIRASGFEYSHRIAFSNDASMQNRALYSFTTCAIYTAAAAAAAAAALTISLQEEEEEEVVVVEEE